jgi:tetratricopeptide (TPR) repeat protein
LLDCFYKLNEYHFALNDYEQALDLTKGNFSTALSYRLAVVHFFLGMNNISKNSLLAAEEDFSSAITYSPSTSRFYVCRARTRNLLKKNTEARCDTITALLLDPQSEECLPLISQLFPGYTVNDLLCSEESLEQRLNLQLQFQTRKNSRRFSHHKDRHINQLTAVSEGTIVKPYNFDVLDLPLPETSKQKGIPPLKFCLEEREFHALIYYAKKAVSYSFDIIFILFCIITVYRSTT